MGEFTSTIERRLREAYDDLHEARATGDLFLAEALVEDIEDLHRVAADHGIPLARPA